MWSRTYCCCAVPLYNSGIYAILSQFFIVSLVTGILTFAAPRIVAVAIPTWGPYIFGAVCIGVALVQLFGFIGVYRERPALFKNYARVNGFLVSAALTIAVAFIALSASRHKDALAKCEASFSDQVGSNSTSTAASAVQSGSDICNIWTWVQVGIMGLLVLIVGVCEIYFLIYQSIYSSEQKLDHARYENVVEQAAEEIRQSGLFSESRPSYDDGLGAPSYTHVRQGSGLRNEIHSQDQYAESSETMIKEDPGAFDQPQPYGMPYQSQAGRGEGRYSSQTGYAATQGSTVYSGEDPYAQAHTAYSAPTPVVQQYGSGGYGDSGGYPERARLEHPLEGQGSRHKAPKLPSPTDTELTGDLRWDPNQYQRQQEKLGYTG